MGNLTHVTVLDLHMNNISGTIPSELSELKLIKGLNLQFNRFTGTISSFLGSFSSLEYLLLGRNSFTGTIPPELGQLSMLQQLALGHNTLQGYIPSALGNLQSMHTIDLYYTGISGTLPASIGNWSSMQHLNMYNNSLDGTIPETIGNLKQLRSITLGLNKLSGSLPQSIGGLSQRLLYLDLLRNRFEGSIPPSWANLHHLEVLYLNENYLTGPITVVCDLWNISQVYLSQNYFSGTVPPCLGNRHLLAEIYLQNNTLTGPIPNTLYQLQRLQYFELNLNLLTSTIPESLSRLQQLQKLSLFNNFLEGTVPPSFSRLRNLVLLLLQNNQLTGPIMNIVNATHQPYLRTLQLSDNQFTGDIPDEPFRIPGFSQFSAVSNCLHGSIPHNICNATALNILALDGVGTARNCRILLFPKLTESYRIRHVIPGGIPTCLFHLPRLITLHLSGNGLTGSLPSDLALGDALVDLALSHNTLTGSIPQSIQERTWYNLDLSYNRFSGTLLETFNTKPVQFTLEITVMQILDIFRTRITDEVGLNLQNNRLSGQVPDTLDDVEGISVLNANVFGCDWQQNDLPRHDSARAGYQCGSNSFNTPYYAWMILTASAVAALIVAWRCQKQGPLQRCFPWLAEAMKLVATWTAAPYLPTAAERLQHVQFAADLGKMLFWVACWVTLAVTVVLLPIYTGLSGKYATVTNQYAWSTSAIFQSGVTPFVVELLVLALILVLIVVLFRHHVQTFLLKRNTDSSRKSAVEEEGGDVFRKSILNKQISRRQLYSAYGAFYAVNFIAVGGANIAFVYIVLYGNRSLLDSAQVLLSFFKGFWNSIGAVTVMRWAFRAIAVGASSADYHSTLLFASLFNNIAIPCLVVLCITPACFYNIFVPAPAVEYKYAYLECAIFALDHCIVYYPRVALTSFNPPFSYSFQCSAQLVTSYAPSFVYLAMEVAFLLPLGQLLSAWLLKSTRRDMHWFEVLSMFTSPMLQLADPNDSSNVRRSSGKTYYDASLYLVQLMTYLGLLLTFGAVFPPLAVALLVAIASLVATNQLVVGRFVADSVEKDALTLLDAIDADCHGFSANHMHKHRIGGLALVFFSGVFYTLFLFDILGDAVGLEGSYWVLLLMPGLVVVYLLASLAGAYIKRRNKHKQQSAEEGDKTIVELTDVTAGIGIMGTSEGSENKSIARDDGPLTVPAEEADNVIHNALHI